MLTVGLGLLTALGWGLHDFIIQPVTRRATPYAALFWVVLVSAVLLMTTSLIVDGVPQGGEEWRSVGIAAVGGVTYVGGVLALFRGLAVGYLSLVTPLAALGGGVGAVLALVLGERVGIAALVAIPLAVLGAVLVSLVPKEAGRETGSVAAGGHAEHHTHVHAASGVGWALLSALLFGATLVIYGYADGVSSVTAAGWGRCAGLLVYLPFALFLVKLPMPRPLMVRAGAAACLDSIAYVAIAEALVLGPVSVASALSSQFATVALVLGIVVLRERPTRIQLLGLACTITAVVLFALSG